MGKFEESLERLKQAMSEQKQSIFSEEVKEIINPEEYFEFWVDCYTPESASIVIGILKNYYYRIRPCKRVDCRNFNCRAADHLWSYSTNDIELRIKEINSRIIVVKVKDVHLYWSRRNLVNMLAKRKWLVNIGVK